MARKELGEDALLIHARPATPETRYLGSYEVVFGMGAPEPVTRAEPDSSAPAGASPQWSSELADLKRQLERLTRTVEKPMPALAGPAASGNAASADPILERLQQEELDPGLAKRVAAGDRLTSLFSTDATLGRPDAGRAIVALVGPPGAGKTSVLVKLAARFGIAARSPIQVLSADTQRIAAADQLRTMCSILGVGCDIAETPAVLTQLIEEYRSRKLILIDTPGFAFREMPEARELAAVVARPDIDTHLVLQASLKPADLRRAADRYDIFRPSKLLFTRLDETSHFGALISEAAHRRRPISFLSAGQQIPDDLEPASGRRLEELVLGDIHPSTAQQSLGAAA